MIEFDEPTRFTLCPEYRAGETGQSYLGRLTGFFGCASPKQFCKDFMLDLQGIQYGDPAALRRLAAMTGADEDELLRCTPLRLDMKFMELGGQVLDNRANPRSRIAICPLCAKEDIAAHPGMPIDQAVHIRREWVPSIIDTCTKHNVKLAVHTAPASTTTKLDVIYHASAILEELAYLPVEEGTPDDFQLYALSRIGGIEPKASPLLDSLPLVTAAQLCHAAGLDLINRRGGAGIPTDIERRAAGFEMLGHDAAGLERIGLEMRRGMIPGEMATRLVPRLLEYMHEAVSLQRNLGTLPDVLVEIMFRLLPYGPGQVLLGRECKEFSVYEFLDARRVYGIQASHLHDFIAGTPELALEIGPGNNNVLIDRAVADKLFLGRTPFITGGELLKRLGRRRGFAGRILGDLVEAGVIEPESGASRAGLPPIYSLPGTEASIAAFIARFEPIDPDAPGTVGLDDITGSYGVLSVDLWKLLASGDLRKMGILPRQGFLPGMRFDRSELVSVMAGVPAAMLVAEVAELLDVPQPVVRNLVAWKHLPCAPGRTGFSSRLILVFDREVVAEFHAKFISARALMRVAGSTFAFGVLVGRGLRPVIDLEGQTKSAGRAVFYRREQAEKLLS